MLPPDDFSLDAPEGFDADDFLLDPDSPAAEALAARKARLARALVTGETGVQFEPLALFAEPLFSLYEHDPSEAFSLQRGADEADDEVVALLEMARVLWAFFSMPPPERARRRPALAAQFVGEDPSDDDVASLDALIDATEIHWQALLPEEIAAAQSTGHPTLDFDALLAHPAFALGDDGGAHDSLPDAEARALFAQPLLDAAGADPDAFEDALARADAYWDIAQADDPDAALDAFARQHPDPSRVRHEGRQMLARYRDLTAG